MGGFSGEAMIGRRIRFAQRRMWFRSSCLWWTQGWCRPHILRVESVLKGSGARAGRRHGEGERGIPKEYANGGEQLRLICSATLRTYGSKASLQVMTAMVGDFRVVVDEESLRDESTRGKGTGSTGQEARPARLSCHANRRSFSWFLIGCSILYPSLRTLTLELFEVLLAKTPFPQDLGKHMSSTIIHLSTPITQTLVLTPAVPFRSV